MTQQLPAPVADIRDRNIHRLLRDLAIDRDLTFASCLDVGCGTSRHDRWFRRFERSTAPKRYIGLEADEELIQQLRDAGVDVRDASGGPGDVTSDLTLCLEVIEHLRPEETPDFMAFVERNTTKAVALTTPNFEYWNGLEQKPEYRECRWIPDHLPFFDVNGGPHEHKQVMTPENLASYMDGTFSSDKWGWQVFRAWPWRLHDLSNDNEFTLFFKLYALAWRR